MFVEFIEIDSISTIGNIAPNFFRVIWILNYDNISSTFRFEDIWTIYLLVFVIIC